MRIKKSKVFFAVIGVLLIIGLIPYSTERIPEWKVIAVDKKGNPLSGIELEEEWRFSSTLGMSRESRVTDENGLAIFPARVFVSPLLIRGILYGFDLMNYYLGHGTAMGGYAVIDSKHSDDFIGYVHGKKENKIMITRP